ncbi:hypothetical protein SFJ1713_4982 [Shigella flexneri SFJ17B]|nr:hypothetical protein SFJ1713_4982 [Shigella flexneri SFJ17B]
MSINIDGRDCCQTGQFSQDVADGALTVVLTVKAQEMAKRGIPFWQAENGVWLTSTVAVEFLEWSFMPTGVQKQ